MSEQRDWYERVTEAAKRISASELGHEAGFLFDKTLVKLNEARRIKEDQAAALESALQAWRME